MTISMKDRDAKLDAIHILFKESPLEATPVKLASNVVKESNCHGRWKMIEQLLNQCQGIVSSLPC